MTTKACRSTVVMMPCFSEKAIDVFKRWFSFAACIIAIILFMFYLGPMMEQHPSVQPMVQFIDERDINSNMYFYTEVEEFSEANINMENSMAFPPRFTSKSANN